LMRMEKELNNRIIGQKEAVELVSNAIKRSRAGISDPNRPIGSFLFLGPTGVGKTELSRALADFLFNDPDSMIRIDMSEFMEKHSISKIIGSPPGYVGHDEGGSVTEQIRRRPYSVILLDEIEKAHPEVFNILLQILDSGHVTDAKGRKVNFKNTVIIMTSNIGAEYIDKMSSFGFTSDHTDKSKYIQTKDKVMQELKEYFRPEFINRLDEIVVFNILSEEDIAKIVSIQLDEVVERLHKKDITLRLNKSVGEFVAKHGYDPKLGARPLRRFIQSKILTPIANLIVKEGVVQGGVIKVDAKKDKLVFTVKKVAGATAGVTSSVIKKGSRKNKISTETVAV